MTGSILVQSFGYFLLPTLNCIPSHTFVHLQNSPLRHSIQIESTVHRTCKEELELAYRDVIGHDLWQDSTSRQEQQWWCLNRSTRKIADHRPVRHSAPSTAKKYDVPESWSASNLTYPELDEMWKRGKACKKRTAFTILSKSRIVENISVQAGPIQEYLPNAAQEASQVL